MQKGRRSRVPPSLLLRRRPGRGFLALSGVQFHRMSGPVGITLQLRLPLPFHALAGDRHFDDGGVGGNVVHDLRENPFHHSPQAASADVAGNGLIGDGLQSLRRELQIHVIILQQFLILLDQGVLGLLQNPHQILPPQGVQ